MISSLDGDTNFFDIVTRVLQEDPMASNLFILSQEHVLHTLIYYVRNGYCKREMTSTAESNPLFLKSQTVQNEAERPM